MRSVKGSIRRIPTVDSALSWREARGTRHVGASRAPKVFLEARAKNLDKLIDVYGNKSFLVNKFEHINVGRL